MTANLMDRGENLDFCIGYLLRQEGVHAELPTTLEGKQRLLRALMNVWPPQPLDDEFLRAQDAELQAQLQDRGIVDLEDIAAPGDAHPTLWQGDITRLRVDAIVNAANSGGLGCWHPLHGCIDNAIHSAAGLQLRQEAGRVLGGGEIATGKAIITPAYNLPSRYVIHTVGPVVPDGMPTEEQDGQLADCYRSCLRLAGETGCRSIAFCCISTGEFRFPNRRAAEIAVATVKQQNDSEPPSPMSVVFNVFKDTDYDIYNELLGTHPEAGRSHS